MRLSLVALLLMVMTGSARAQEVVRYHGALRGGLAITGNSVGLSKDNGVNGPGNRGGIGTFMAAGTTLQDGTFPVGTTDDWTMNASDAVLLLPAGAEVVYAELLWGGSFEYGVEDVTSSLDLAITLAADGISHSVTPAAATAGTIDQIGMTVFDVKYYWRSADVTALVQMHGDGTYRAAGIPATQDSTVDTLQAAGWSLFVVYRDPAAPARAVELQIGGDYIEESESFEYLFDGFCAVATGPVSGTVAVTALEGDAELVGDTLSAHETGDAPVALSGTFNLADNFFASQINSITGARDTSGTFGSSNHSPGVPVSGGRQSWDLAGLPLGASSLVNAQETLTVRAATSGDAFAIVAAAIQVTIDAPALAVIADIDDDSLEVNQSATIRLVIANDGTAAASDLRLSAPLPAGVVLDSVSVAGTTMPADLDSGVELGALAIGASVEVTLVLHASTAGDFAVSPTLAFSFLQCAGASASNDQLTLLPLGLSVAGPGDASGGHVPGGVASREGGGCVASARGSRGLLLVLALVLCARGLGLRRRRRRATGYKR